jgi:glycosyltransferase involved in cell wall biosynthesis
MGKPEMRLMLGDALPDGLAVATREPSHDAPPKVLIVVEAAGGGSGRHVIELAEGLVSAGCLVHLIYSELRMDANFRSGLAQIKGVRLLSVPMRREPHFTDFACMMRIRRYIREAGGFDIIHAHSSKAGVLARIAGIGSGAAKIYTPHAMRTMDPTINPLMHLGYRLTEVALARFCSDSIIAVSAQERSHIVSQGIPAEKTCIIVNGVPRAQARDRNAIRRSLGLAENDFCVGFIGRLVVQKAPERFVEAFAALARSAPNARGVIVGSGPLQQAVRTAAHNAGVFEKIVWIIDQAGPAVLPAFDVLLLPSLYEGMPYVLLEALAAGVPIVSTDVGGAQEAIEDGLSGFIVPQNAAEDLEQRLIRLAKDELLRQKMKAASLRKSLDLSLEHMVAQTLSVYRGSVQSRRPDRPRVAVSLGPTRV